MTKEQYHKYLASKEWKMLKWAALWHAGFKCQTCGSRDHLTVHHSFYGRVGGGERPEDLLVSCRKCHYLFEVRRRRAEKPWESNMPLFEKAAKKDGS